MLMCVTSWIKQINNCVLAHFGTGASYPYTLAYHFGVPGPYCYCRASRADAACHEALRRQFAKETVG